MGPLSGLRIIEMKGIGPGPYAGMLLADMGAEVIVVERASKPNSIAAPSALDIHSRGKKSIALNLKSEEGIETLLKLIESADGLLEGFRPGVMERLGVGPEVCLERNPKLVFGRMTGWGQTGPLAHAAGHDINYISITGAAAAIGTAEKPVPPLNLVGDYAGGSLFLVMGMLAALLNAKNTGQGDVVDTAITDGSASLMSMFYTMSNLKQWTPNRAGNLLDGGAPFYDTYQTSDDKFISLGPIEPQFFALLVEKTGLPQDFLADQNNPKRFAEIKATLTELFKSKTRDEWCELLEGTDACFAPILDYQEAIEHEHNKARETYIDINGVVQPAPAPRFSHSQGGKPAAPHAEGADTEAVLADLGLDQSAIDELKANGVLT